MRYTVFITLVATCLLHVTKATYSNSFEVNAVTTFLDCSNASSIDPVTQSKVCLNNSSPITVLSYFVLPGQDDAAGGSEMAFYTYPQPFTNMPINQQNGSPSDNPCQQASATTNCTWFNTPGTNITGPIIMTAKVSSVVRKYKLVQILNKNSAPYSYLNHDATVPKCPADYCTNGCSNEQFNKCDPAGGKTQSSFYACCAIQDDYVGGNSPQCSDDKNHQGNLFAQANELYDYNDNRYALTQCGAADSELLYDYGQGLTSTDQPAFVRGGGCRSCSMAASAGAFRSSDAVWLIRLPLSLIHI